MGLKSCLDCGKTSHTDNHHCIYCGSVKFKTTDLLDSAWLIFAIFSILVMLTFFYGTQVLNQLNVGVISARDFRDCTNDRIVTSMKNTFNHSDYALKKELTVATLAAKSYPFQHQDALIACRADLTLSNGTNSAYIYQIKYLDGQYIFEHYPLGRSDTENKIKPL